MLFKNPLDSILGQTSKVKILRFLNSIRTELNGREISKSTGVSHVRCHAALRDMARHGIIIIRNIGRSTVYKVNHDHILYKGLLKPLFDSESVLINNLVDYIIKNIKEFKPISVIIYGSTTKDEARPDSDIDMLIVLPDVSDLKKIREKIESTEESISSRFGNQFSPVLIKKKDLQQKYKQKNNLYTEIIKTGKVIYGKTISELL